MDVYGRYIYILTNIKRPISMVPMECGNSKRQTMVLFRGCLIWTGEGITKKIGIDTMEELQFH